jgi:hypothetical protein
MVDLVLSRQGLLHGIEHCTVHERKSKYEDAPQNCQRYNADPTKYFILCQLSIKEPSFVLFPVIEI